jgi:hypothetical protein
MKNMYRDSAKVTRRGLFRNTALGVMGASAMGGCARFGGGAAAASEYRIVPGWPKKGMPDVATRGIDADGKGRIYVSGDELNPVLMLTPDGDLLGSWGQNTLVNPHGVRIQGDTVWVSDIAMHQVHQFTLAGKLIRSFGVRDEAGDAPDHFNKPTDFAFARNGDIYISDGYLNTRVICLAPNGSIRRIWGRKGTGPSEFDLVHAVAMEDSSRVYVSDRSNNRVQIFDLEGNFITQWKHVGRPYGFDVLPDSTIFICGLDVDTERWQIKHLDRNGNVLADFGSTGEGPGQFLMAHSIMVDRKGGVIVADGKANRIQKFEPVR